MQEEKKLEQNKDEDCDDCNFTVGVSMTESVCNFLGEQGKEKCEDIIKKVKSGEKSFGESLEEIGREFEDSMLIISEMKQIAKEKGLYDVKAKPQ